MAISKASAQWQGTLKDGRGNMKPANAAEVPFNLGTRFEGVKGSSPEEMIGAALAGCFSMALAASLAQVGVAPQTIQTDASVRLEKDGPGFSITQITLTTKAKIPGLDDAKFQQIAQETKKNCPVSKALAGTKIELTAALES
jgi:osmotically inducible protein OsmC